MRNYTFSFLFCQEYGIEELWMETIHADTIQDAWTHLVKKEHASNEDGDSLQKVHKSLFEDLSAVHIKFNHPDPGELGEETGLHTKHFPEDLNAIALIEKITF